MMSYREVPAYVKTENNDSFHQPNQLSEYSQDSTYESEQFSLYGGLLQKQQKNSYKQSEYKQQCCTQNQQFFLPEEQANQNANRLKGYKNHQQPQQQQYGIQQYQQQQRIQSNKYQQQKLFREQYLFQQTERRNNYFSTNFPRYPENYPSSYVKMVQNYMEVLCHFLLQEPIDQYQENRRILLKMRIEDNFVHIKLNAETQEACEKLKKEIKISMHHNKLIEFPLEIDNLFEKINEFLGFIQKQVAERVDLIDMKRQFYIYSKDEILDHADVLDHKFSTEFKRLLLKDSQYKQSIFYRCNAQDVESITHHLRQTLESYQLTLLVPPPIGIKSFIQLKEMKEEKIVKLIKDHKTSSHSSGFQVHFYNTNDERLENIEFEVEDFYTYLGQNFNDPITITPAYGQQRLYFQIEIPEEVDMRQMKSKVISILDGYINYSFNYVVNYQSVNKSELDKLRQLENCSIDIIRVNTSFRGLTQTNYQHCDCGFGLMFKIRNLIYSKLRNGYFISQLHSLLPDKSLLQPEIDDSPQVKLLTKNQINRLEQKGQEFHIVRKVPTLWPDCYWVALTEEWQKDSDDENDDEDYQANFEIELNNSRFFLYSLEQVQDIKKYSKNLKEKRQSLQLTLFQLDQLESLFQEIVFYIPIPIGMDSKHLEEYISKQRFEKKVSKIMNLNRLQKGRYLIGRAFGPIENNEFINLEQGQYIILSILEVDWKRLR